MNSRLKAKIKVNKLSDNPLFIKFLNWTGDKFAIESFFKNLAESFEKKEDVQIIRSTSLTEEYLQNLDNFKIKFKSYLAKAIASNNISEEFLAWLSNAYKYIQEDIQLYGNNETRTISIKDPTGRWFEAILCYNFICTFNNFGLDVIKFCPICSKFFSHKGRYARYCSDACKSKGVQIRKAV